MRCVCGCEVCVCVCVCVRCVCVCMRMLACMRACVSVYVFCKDGSTGYPLLAGIFALWHTNDLHISTRYLKGTNIGIGLATQV